MGFKENVKKGLNELLVLSVLNTNDMYGYQIARLISEMSDGGYTVAEGSLYPILYRLLQAGHITEHTEIVKHRPRVYYHLEESGKEYFSSCLKEYQQLTNCIYQVLDVNVNAAKSE